MDKRTDIWAFGCVLFESLARRRAFRGATALDCMAAVLAGEPDWEALPASMPPNIHALLRRCLEKDPRRRLRDIGDAGIELDEALAGRDNSAMPTVRVGPSKHGILAAGFLAGALVVSMAAHPWRQDAPLRCVTRFAVPFASNEILRSSNSPQVVISPDGARGAYQCNRDGVQQIYVRSIDQQEAKPIPGANGGASFFSPDGRWVAYCSNESGRAEVYVTSFPGPGARIQVSTDGGTDPVLAAQGRRALLPARRQDDGRIGCNPTETQPVETAHSLGRELHARHVGIVRRARGDLYQLRRHRRWRTVCDDPGRSGAAG